MTTTFIRLLNADDKPSMLRQVVAEYNNGGANPFVFRVDPQEFKQVPGTPLAYWVSEHVRNVYKSFQPLECNERTARTGLNTTYDFRFVRVFWEIRTALIAHSRIDTVTGKKWVVFSRGGGSSPYYYDLPLVLDWENDGTIFKEYIRSRGDSPSRNARSEDKYFYAGLTWPLRASRFSPYILPTGCIFGVRGQAVIAGKSQLSSMLGICNSQVFNSLYKISLGREAHPEYVVGVLQNLPIPENAIKMLELSEIAAKSNRAKRSLDSSTEISHVFHMPAVLQAEGDTLAKRVEAWMKHIAHAHKQLDTNQCAIDRIALELYGLTEDDIRLPEEKAAQKIADTSNGGDEASVDATDSDSIDSSDIDEVEPEEDSLNLDLRTHAEALISYLVGCAFGRWDIRYATGDKTAPVLPDPFDPLPACSPGMLTGDDGLPLLTAPAGYPLRIDADGILVDDPDHQDDIVRRVREALDVIFGERAEAWERDLCPALEVNDLRDYVRKGTFWQAHIKRYSKSRRKAPIYWLLQSPRKHYAIWLYYHRLEPDTLFKALVKYAEPKLRREQSKLDELQTKRHITATPKEQRAVDREVERQQAVVSDVQAFCERLERAAKLYLAPDLNDGVVLTIAPLHELVPWREAGRYWDELRAGKYEWSSIGKQMREKGLVK